MGGLEPRGLENRAGDSRWPGVGGGNQGWLPHHRVVVQFGTKQIAFALNASPVLPLPFGEIF